MRILRILMIAALCLSFSTAEIEAKKVKTALTVKKEGKGELKKGSGSKNEPEIEGLRIEMNKEYALSGLLTPEEMAALGEIKFTGYDKEPSSSKESFIIVNPGYRNLKGFKVRIDYLDMQGRMLHSQNLTRALDVPGGESRRLDIPAWDTQHTYYYYLGNEPKRVATPFKVKFTPMVFWIEEPEK